MSTLLFFLDEIYDLKQTCAPTFHGFVTHCLSFSGFFVTGLCILLCAVVGFAAPSFILFWSFNNDQGVFIAGWITAGICFFALVLAACCYCCGSCWSGTTGIGSFVMFIVKILAKVGFVSEHNIASWFMPKEIDEVDEEGSW